MEIPTVIRKEDFNEISTSDEKEFDSYNNSPDKFKILIDPFNTENIQAASYDICVGDTCKNLTTEDEEIKEINIKDKSIVIKPNECFLIKTKEKIGVPLNCTALVTTKISLSMVGIFQVTSRIDPGFKDKLDITLFNAGERKVSLRSGESFANLLFLKIGTPTSHGYDGQPTEKVTDDYDPILEDVVKNDREKALKSLLKKGPPFDTIAHLLKLHTENTDSKLSTIVNTLRRENIVYKFILGLLTLLLLAKL